MNCYQLSCGCWQSDPREYEIGGILGCLRCNTLRTVIIGMTSRAEWPG